MSNSIKLRINHDFSKYGTNSTGYSDELFNLLQKQTITSVKIEKDNHILVSFGVDHNNDRFFSRDTFIRFLETQNLNFMVTTNVVEDINYIFKTYKNSKVDFCEIINDVKIVLHKTDGSILEFLCETEVHLLKKLKYLASAEDKFTEAGLQSINDCINIADEDIHGAERLKKELEKKKKQEEKRLKEEQERIAFEKMHAEEVRKLFEKSDKDTMDKLAQRNAEDKKRVLAELENEVKLEEAVNDDSARYCEWLVKTYMDSVVDSIYASENPSETFDKLLDESISDLKKYLTNKSNRKSRFKKKYKDKIIAKYKSMGLDYSEGEFSLLNIDSLFEKYENHKSEQQQRQKRMKEAMDASDRLIKEKINEYRQEVKYIAEDMLKEFKTANYHTRATMLKGLPNVDTSKIKGNALRNMSRYRTKSTKNAALVKGYQKVTGTYVSIFKPEIKLPSGRIIPAINEKTYQYENIFRVSNLKKMKIPFSNIASSTIKKAHGCILAATFFQLLVSNTPLDEEYEYEETRYVIRGFSRIKYSTKVNIDQELDNIIQGKYTDEAAARRAMALITRMDTSTGKVVKTRKGIEKSAKENLYIKQIRIRRTHKPDHKGKNIDSVRDSWELHFRGKKFKSRDFNPDLFEKKGDEASIREIANIIYSRVENDKFTSINFTYNNTNPRWELLEYGYYRGDSGPNKGDKYQHGVKDSHSVQAPKGFVRLTEAMWNTYCDSGKPFTTTADFLKTIKAFDVSDTGNSEMKKIIDSDVSVANNTVDLENWRQVI